MTKEQLFEQIITKQSFLCIGLDTDINKIPSHLLKHHDPVFEFNRQIIDATKEFCVAYKPNTAFYEYRGLVGWQSLISTFNCIPTDVFSIADAKRGDIGNTASMYAKAFFDKESSGFESDAVTVAPYMGKDSVQPFLEFQNKWAIVLALTSNPGSADFQLLQSEDKFLFEKVLQETTQWGSVDNLMFVVGATQGEFFLKIRQIVPEHFLLVPGVGAQGGSLEEVAKFGMNKQCGLLVNSSRAIIFASKGEDFAEKAREEAKKLQAQMAILLDKYVSG